MVARKVFSLGEVMFKEEVKTTNVLLVTLMGIVILLMIAITGLFIRMNQLQNEVITALASSSETVIGNGEEGLKSGVQAPDFTLKTVEDEAVSLKDFSGHWVLLAFTSTTCPHCTAMYPHLKAFSESRRDVQVVMVSKGTVEENRKIIQEQDLRFPVLTLEDSQMKIATDFKVPGTPFFFVLDKQSVIRKTAYANTLDQLKALVESIIQ
jgi:methylamine dehydrogenase accessory protein MauD